MKIYVKAAKTISGQSTVEQVEEFLRSVDPEFYKDVEYFYIEGLSGTSKRNIATMTVKVKKINKYFKAKCRCPISEDDLINMSKEVQDQVNEYHKESSDKKALLQELKSKGLKKLSAQTFVNSQITKRYGMSPSYTFSDTHKSMYMLYSTPYGDVHTGMLDVDGLEQFYSEIEELFEEISTRYGIEIYNVYMPTRGNKIRTAFQFQTYGPDIIVDKNTGEGVCTLPEYLGEAG